MYKIQKNRLKISLQKKWIQHLQIQTEQESYFTMQKAIRECSPRTSLQKAPNASIEIFLAIDLFYCFSRIEIRNIEEHPFNPFTLHTQSPPVSCGFHPPIRGTSAGISRPKFVFQSLSWRCFVSSFFSPISPGDKKARFATGFHFSSVHSCKFTLAFAAPYRLML